MKSDVKLYKEDINAIIKCKEYCILAFKYIEKSLDGFYYNLDKCRNI